MGETPKEGRQKHCGMYRKDKKRKKLDIWSLNEFQNHWTELRDAIVEIEKCLTSGNLYERGVELLLSCDLNPQKSKEYEDEFKRIQGEYISLK